MNYFINKVLIRNFKKIPYFFETRQRFNIEHTNYALIGRLSTSLLHDILTPLTSLSLTTSLTNVQHTKSLEPIIKHSTNQIQEYVEIMRDFLNENKIESVVHVNKEILKCITLLQHKAIEQGIQIQYIEFDQVHTQIQPLHIYQIIINLLSNAIEASLITQNKKIILILKKEKDSFCIECKDFGTGIAPDTLTKIGTYNFSTKSPSRGFGLYSLQHIVTQLLKGKMDIQSEPDMGSLFSCTLPLRK